MRIAVSGTSNCGKTTLANALGDAMDLDVVSEFYGEPYSSGPALSQQQEAERFQAILDAKTVRETELGSSISDRSPIDLAYNWLIRALPLKYPEPSREFLSKSKLVARQFDAIIFPPGPAPEAGTQNYYGRPDRIWEMWRNHNAMIGMAVRWLEPDQLVLIPDHLNSVDAWINWLQETRGIGKASTQ